MSVRWLLLWLVVAVAGATALAQIPQGVGITGGPRYTSYRDTPQGKKLDFLIVGSSATNGANGTAMITDFRLQSFHNGNAKQVQVIVQAPHCALDMKRMVASDSGPLEIFTPTTNLFTQGRGFLFTQANHFLVISNDVETRVIKSMLKSALTGPAHTNSGQGTNTPQFLKIFANFATFDFDSNVVQYAGNVHVIDPQLDMTSHLLTIQFSTNGTVKSILAQMDVVLTTTNNGRATGQTGYYYVTNGSEMMKLTTDATWRNGAQEAKANEFTYDSTRHLLTGSGHLRVRWPNSPVGTAKATNAGVNDFRTMIADFAVLQFPPTNGPVESMHARGNVVLANQADGSSAVADKADYDRNLDRVELTGHPLWQNDKMEVNAQVLSAELSDKIYHAHTNAHFKMLTRGATNQPPSERAANQWLYISSDNIDYRTNLALFIDHVDGQLVQDGKVQDTLKCKLLTLNMTNSDVQSATASGDVHGESAPDKAGVVKTVDCQVLNAYPAARKGSLKSIDAHGHVILQELSSRIGAPTNRLAAENVTAHFSPFTNQIEQAVAQDNVVIDQMRSGGNIHASAARAVYTGGSNELVKLTGQPIARRDTYIISDADYMIWQPQLSKFQAFGRYKIVSTKRAAAKKSP